MLYSHSRIKTFEQCPQKFKFQYLEKVQIEERDSIEAFLGSRVHEALEKLYKDAKNEKLNSLEETLEWYSDNWDKNWTDSVIIVKKDFSPKNYKQMGEKFIREYYERHHPFNQTKTVGIEQRVTLDLGEGFQLQGYIDRLAFNPKKDEWEIHDYKTSAHLPLNEELEEDRQLALYALAIQKQYQDAKKIKLVWHFLAYDKDLVIEKSKDELEQLRKDTITSIKLLESAKDFPTRTSALCDWCQFKPICPAWKHIYKVETLSVNKYLADDGVKLVNKYAELKAKSKETTQAIEKELNQVEEALIQFAKKEGAEVIAGSDFNARVKERESLSFPDKNDDEAREHIRKLLEKEGLWDEVSALDTYNLAKYVNSFPFDPDDPSKPSPISPNTLKALNKFITRRKTTSVYLGKK